MKKIILFAAIFAVLLFVACHRGGGAAPISTSSVPAAIVAVPEPVVPMEAPLAVAPDANATSTSESSVNTAESALATPSAPLNCYRRICVGTGVEEVGKIAAFSDANESATSGCQGGDLREVPLSNPAPDIKRFVYVQKCGGSITQSAFVFYKDSMTTYYVYFSASYFRRISAEDFVVRIEKIFGTPKVKKWRKSGGDGELVWEDGQYRVTLEIFGSTPMMLKIEDVAAQDAAAAYLQAFQKETGIKKLDNAVY